MGFHVGDARDTGSVTAEFAILVPAVCLILAASLGGLQLAARQIGLQDAAAIAARSAARGEPATPSAVGVGAGGRILQERRGNLLCVRVEAPAGSIAHLLGFATLSASSCTLAHGR